MNDMKKVCPFRTYLRKTKGGGEAKRFCECLYKQCAMYDVKSGECRMRK